MRVLLVRHDKLGDLIVSTPVFQALKETFPGIHLTLWIQDGLLDVLRHNPYVDDVDYTMLKPNFKEGMAMLGQMRRSKFDKVVFLKDRAGVHVPVSFFAGIKERNGSIRKPYKVFLTQNLGIHREASHDHETEFCYQICEAAFGVPLARHPLLLNYPPDAKAEGLRVLEDIGVSKGFFCVHPGNGGTSTPWYPESYGRAAEIIAQRTGLIPVFTGTANETDLVAQALSQCPKGLSIAGQTKLLPLAAILKQARLLVSANTGAMHVAATQRTPTVMVEPTPDVQQHWDKWRPYGCPCRLAGASKVCTGCDAINCHQQDHECKDTITVDQVVAASLDLLQGT